MLLYVILKFGYFVFLKGKRVSGFIFKGGKLRWIVLLKGKFKGEFLGVQSRPVAATLIVNGACSFNISSPSRKKKKRIMFRDTLHLFIRV